MARGVGRSLYKGLRVTMTESRNGNTLLFVATKRHRAGWDEWDSLGPARRLLSGHVESTPQALRVLSVALEELAAELEADL